MNRFCTEITCTKVQNVLLDYAYFPKAKGQYVVNCRSGGKPPYVYRCEAGFEANLNTLPVICEHICKSDSKLAFPGDSTKYYQCIYDGLGWVSRVKTCYRDYYFDNNSKQCLINPTKAPVTTTTLTSTTTTTTKETPTTTTTDSTTVTLSTATANVPGTKAPSGWNRLRTV